MERVRSQPLRRVLEHARKTLHERAEADAQRSHDPQRVRAAPRHEGEGRGGAGHAEAGRDVAEYTLPASCRSRRVIAAQCLAASSIDGATTCSVFTSIDTATSAAPLTATTAPAPCWRASPAFSMRSVPSTHLCGRVAGSRELGAAF